MTDQKQKQIADSFPDNFQEFDLDLTFTADEFKVFDDGVFASSMDEKWNIFVHDNFMYWARSWTGHCIFKVQVIRQTDTVILKMGFVTRDKTQYNSVNIEKDKTLFLTLLQTYLDRDDIYIDPAFEFPIIKDVIVQYDPQNKKFKSIGRGNNVGLTKSIYDGLTAHSSDSCYVTGWQELKSNIAARNDEEDLLSLYMQDRETSKGTTFYFDTEGKRLLGQVTVRHITNSR